MNILEKSVGFIDKHNLWTDDQKRQAKEILQKVEREHIHSIRIGWGDIHGIIRGKTISVEELKYTFRDGRDFQGCFGILDTTNHPCVAPFSDKAEAGIPELIGIPDTILVPDPSTFRIVPWAEGTASILSDLYFLNGKEAPFNTRGILRRQLAKAAAAGYATTMIGVELEFGIFKLLDPKLEPIRSGWPAQEPSVNLSCHGFQYLAEVTNDLVGDILHPLKANLEAYGLPLLTMEIEFGPSQYEVNLRPLPAMEAADAVLALRSAIKQVCRRKGYHASFMARTNLPNVFVSGWHLHQSLWTADEKSVFLNTSGPDPLSKVGMNYLGGILQHAPGTALLSTPTINGYKRQMPDSFAPTRACWDVENRGVMVRLLGGPGDPLSHIENRVGEPAANPYLYMAANLIAGLDGIKNKIDPGGRSLGGYAAMDRPPLPTNIIQAIAGLKEDAVVRQELGETFANLLIKMKEFEVNRFMTSVTDWEMREYFDTY